MPTCVLPASHNEWATWSAVIAAAIGFSGVIVSLLWNAAQARGAEERKRADESAAKEESVRVLRAALLAALESMRDLLEREIAFIQGSEGTWFPLVDFFEVYRENLPSIGLLTTGEVRSLSRAYTGYQERLTYIIRSAGCRLDHVPFGTSVEFKFDQGEHSQEKVLGDLRPLLPLIRQAVAELLIQFGS